MGELTALPQAPKTYLGGLILKGGKGENRAGERRGGEKREEKRGNGRGEAGSSSFALGAYDGVAKPRIKDG